MTPIEFKNFCDKNRDAFFAKFPKPSKSGPRAYWKQMIRHADNASECGGIAGYFEERTFDEAAEKIRKMMAV